MPGEPVKELPPLILRIGNFTKAFVQHVSTGAKYVDQAEVTRRHSICESCTGPEGFFNGTHCTHKDCGCPITSTGGFLDKLAWASSSCPIGKW